MTEMPKGGPDHEVLVGPRDLYHEPFPGAWNNKLAQVVAREEGKDAHQVLEEINATDTDYQEYIERHPEKGGVIWPH